MVDRPPLSAAWLRRPARATGLLAAALFLVACRARAVAPDLSPTAHLHVLMVNGGGSKVQNYQSHFLHLRRLLELLGRAGVPPSRITVFDADGPDPAADMAVRELDPDAELGPLRGTHLAGPLGAPIVYANSEIPGVVLHPATRAGLAGWFKTARKQLRAGDTLLIYVTDHGFRNEKDTGDNRIVLWGEKESISVGELRELVAKLDPGVRVVALMSQCFSGAFANLMSVHARDGQPGGAVCGYFSSTPDRPAYGCYPENRGKDNVGHSFHFFQALETSEAFPQAHLEVLATDRTPDVPNRTSQVYLERLLERAAHDAGEEPPAFIDGLVREAWRDKATWEPEIRLLDRIAHAFGVFSPRSLAELDAQTKSLPDVAEQLRTNGVLWKAVLGDADEANLKRFLDTHPDWVQRTDGATVALLGPDGRRALAGALLGDLVPFTSAAGTDARLRVLRDKGETASAAGYRMEVRLAVVLRLRAVLTEVAGRVYLATRATPAERAAYDALRACEDLRLPPAAGAPPATAGPAFEPFPPWEDDVKLAHEVLPAWMGINFRPASEKTRAKYKLADGATSVLTVYPDSPAQSAGLQVGDIILGPPGKPFTEPRQVREWTMLSAVGRPAPLAVQRGERQVRVTLVPKPYPIRLPELPGPPQVGSVAPPLKVTAYRGALPEHLADGKRHLLLFWATWCAPCKASLPEVLAFEQERGVQVIAITDEPADQLDPFFQKFTAPFPATVAVDELRSAFLAYGVSGTPAFVLVDGDGKVESAWTGYTAEKGLGIEGWSWSKRTAR